MAYTRVTSRVDGVWAVVGPIGTPSRRRWRETPRARGTKRRTQAYNLVKAGLLEKPLEFGFVMGAPNAQECDLRVLKCCGAFTLSM